MWGLGVTFDEVAVYFSAEEWDTLEKWQKELYKEVVVEQYQALLSIGLMTVIPEIILRIMMGEEPVVNHKRATCVTPAPETAGPETAGPETTGPETSSARTQGYTIIRLQSDTPTRPEGNTPTRPEGNTPTRPEGNTPTRPEGNAPTRPEGNAPTRPEGNAPTRPEGNAPTRPEGNAPTRPEGNTPTRPEGNTPTRPEGNAPTRPEGNAPTRPEGNAPTRPEGNAPTRPEGNAPTRPEGNAPTRPEGNTPTRPEGNAPTRPEGNAPTRPEGNAPTRPEGNTPTRPEGNTPTRPPGSTSRILEDSQDNTSNTKVNLRPKILNIPTEIYPISARQEEEGEVHKNILENHSDPDEGLMPTIEKKTRVEKLHVCMDCGKRFSLHSSLIKHTTANSCIRPHLCSDCGASFNYQTQLLIHQKRHIDSKFHKCSTCGKCFLRKSSLDVHIRSHTGEKPFSCSLCNKRFNEASKLRRHLRIHTGEKPFRCHCCGKCFNDSSVLIRHGKWYCPLKKGKPRKPVREEPRNESQREPSITRVKGGQVSSSLLTLKAEVMERGQGDPQVVADTTVFLMEQLNSVGGTYQEITKPLDGGIKDWTPVTYLMLIVPPAPSSDIRIQNTRTLSQENMVQGMDNRVNSKSVNHQNTTKFGLKTKRDENIVLTSACNPHEGPPATNVNLVAHKSNAEEQLYPLSVKQEHEDELLENTTCEIRLIPPSGIKCEVDEGELTQQTTWSTQDAFKTKEDISRFTQRTNQESPRIICATKVCDGEAISQHGQAKNQESLGYQKTGTKRSKKTVADIKQKTCGKCGESFTYDCRRLIPHRCQEKLFHCDCGESFKHDFQLEQHQKTQCSFKTYKCQKCKKAFKCEANLIQHLRTHSEVRPYPCTECGKAFKEGGKLRRHLRIHTGEKPFRCAECGRRFNDQSSLNRHVKIHTAKAYQCSQCRRIFRGAPGLHRHIKTHRSR